MLAGVREPAMRRSEKWGRGFANNDKLCEAFQQCGKLWAPERAMRVSEHASSADQRTICITHVVGGKPTSQLGREWEISYTWPILQVNFCCLWVIFFLEASRRRAFTCLTCMQRPVICLISPWCRVFWSMLPGMNALACCRDRTVVPSLTIKPRHTGTRLILTPHFYGQFALSLRKESP